MTVSLRADSLRRSHLSYVLLAVCVAAGLVACEPTDAPLVIEHAVVALPTGGASAAFYVTLRNPDSLPISVIGVDVHGSGGSALQTTTAHRPIANEVHEDGMSSLLTTLDSVPIPARGAVRFAPGGYVVTVFPGPKTFTRGDSITVTLWLSDRVIQRTKALVVNYTDLDTTLTSPSVVATGTDADTEPSVEDGRELYLGNGCANCHGVEGHGNGRLSASLTPPPRDFRSATGFRNGADEAAIAQTLATRIPNGGQMPLFAHLSTTERRSIARYLISLRSSQSSSTGTP